MKNVILASILVLGGSVFANETAPAATTAPAASSSEVAPAQDNMGKKEEKKAAKHAKGHKKADKKVEAGK